MCRLNLAVAAVLVLTFGLSAWASGQDEKPTRNETRLNAQLHRSFRIVVDSNPSTGYSWTAVFDKSFLELVNSRYERPSPQIPGLGGKQEFFFRPLKRGETVIELQYKRPWEPDVFPAEIRKYAVSIHAAEQGN